MSEGLLDFQRRMREGGQEFSNMFQDRLPFHGLSSAGPLTREDYERAEVVGNGFARVLDSWNPEDMQQLQHVWDMQAKGVFVIKQHLASFPVQQDPNKPPRLMIYLVWYELHRELRRAEAPQPKPEVVQWPTESPFPFPGPSDAHISRWPDPPKPVVPPI